MVETSQNASMLWPIRGRNQPNYMVILLNTIELDRLYREIRDRAIRYTQTAEID
jgi:hypothetical protein